MRRGRKREGQIGGREEREGDGRVVGVQTSAKLAREATSISLCSNILVQFSRRLLTSNKSFSCSLGLDWCMEAMLRCSDCYFVC